MFAVRDKHDDGRADNNVARYEPRAPHQLLVHTLNTSQNSVEGCARSCEALDFCKPVDQKPARDFTVTMSSHSVGDRPQSDIRALEKPVFVAFSNIAGMGARHGLELYRLFVPQHVRSRLQTRLRKCTKVVEVPKLMLVGVTKGDVHGAFWIAERAPADFRVEVNVGPP